MKNYFDAKKMGRITKVAVDECIEIINKNLKLTEFDALRKTLAMSIVTGLVINVMSSIEENHTKKMRTLNHLYEMLRAEFMENYMEKKS